MQDLIGLQSKYADLYGQHPAPAYKNRKPWLINKIDEAIAQKKNEKAEKAPATIEEPEATKRNPEYVTRNGADGTPKKDKYGRTRYWDKNGVEVTNFMQ